MAIKQQVRQVASSPGGVEHLVARAHSLPFQAKRNKMNPAGAAQPAKSNGETSRTTPFTATASTLQKPPATALATGITVGTPHRESVAREFTLPSLPAEIIQEILLRLAFSHEPCSYRDRTVNASPVEPSHTRPHSPTFNAKERKWVIQ